MKVCVLVCIAFVGLACAGPKEKYSSKYDDLDLDEILKSNSHVTGYAKCLLNKGTCTPEGAELKSIIHEALENKCAKCTKKQKEGAKKVITFLAKNKKDLWQELQAKYDPDSKYRKKYEAQLKAAGIF